MNCALMANVSWVTVPVTCTLPQAALAAALKRLPPLTAVVQDAEVLWLVAVTTVVLAALGARRIDVTWWGKAGTFGLMMAFPFFLMAESTVSGAGAAHVAAWLTAIPGLIFSYVSWAMYLPIGLRALREGREARAAAEAAG